jgi:hypothetical protein
MTQRLTVVSAHTKHAFTFSLSLASVLLLVLCTQNTHSHFLSFSFSLLPLSSYFFGAGKPTTRPSHIVHHSDGTVTQETEPDPNTGEETSMAYRSNVRQIIFKPCKKHPIHGCEMDPPMPIPTSPPAPLEPMVVTDVAARPAPQFTVDEEGRRFARSMFDDAADYDAEPGPITHDMVEDLENKYKRQL